MTTEWIRARERFDARDLPTVIERLWQGDPLSPAYVSSDYNIVYRFEIAGQGAFLRICHPALHPLTKARQTLHFLRFLAENDVPVGQPIPSARGNFIELLDKGFYAAAQREAPGDLMSLHLLDLSVYEAWGRSLGQLHAASRRYQPSAAIDYSFPTVQRFWNNIASTIRASSLELQRAYAELTEWMNALPPRDFGLIHGDYRPGNVVWDGATARTIDFDEPNYHWYIADVSRALLELSGLRLSDRRRFREAFVRGYLREHEIDDFWVTQLPQFAQHRGVLMHAWDLQEGGSGSGSLGWALGRVGW